MTSRPRTTRQQIDRVPVERDEDVHAHTVGVGQWRVLDLRVHSDDIRALLGFIQESDNGFEVMFITEPGVAYTFDTLADARHSFTQRTTPPE